MAKTFKVQSLKQVDLGTVNTLVRSLNEGFTQIARALDDILAGRSTFTGDLDLGGNRATNAATPQADDDLVTLGSLEEEVDRLLRAWGERLTSAGDDAGIVGSGGGGTSGAGDDDGDDVERVLDGVVDTGVVFGRSTGGSVELATDASQLSWDDTNDRLGIGTGSPKSNFDLTLDYAKCDVPGLLVRYGGSDLPNSGIQWRFGLTGNLNVANNVIADMRVLTRTVPTASVGREGDIRFHLGNDNGLGTGTTVFTERFRFRSGGRFSISRNINAGLTVDGSSALTVMEGEATTLPSSPEDNTVLFIKNNATTDDCLVAIVAGATGDSILNFGDVNDYDAGKIDYDHNVDAMAFVTATTERIRFTATNLEATPGLVLEGDLDTGLWHPAADTLAFSTGGAERFRFNTTEFVHNEDGDDYDFRVESDTVPNAFVVDAGLNQVGLNNVLYAWPAANAVGALSNDGAGVLSWAASTPASHVLATNLALGATHTVSGTAAGEFLRASSTSAANFQALALGDLPATVARSSGTPANTQLAFWVSANEVAGDSGLIVDSANNRIGIGRTPGVPLDVAIGIGTVPTTTSPGIILRLQNNDSDYDDAGIQFIGKNNGTCSLFFADDDSWSAGNIQYYHPLDILMMQAGNQYCFIGASTYEWLPNKVGIGGSAGFYEADAPLEVETTTTVGKQAISIDQNDADQPFIDFQGSVAADAVATVSSLTTSGAVQGHLQIEVNGAKYWLPYLGDPS